MCNILYSVPGYPDKNQPTTQSSCWTSFLKCTHARRTGFLDLNHWRVTVLLVVYLHIPMDVGALCLLLKGWKIVTGNNKPFCLWPKHTRDSGRYSLVIRNTQDSSSSSKDLWLLKLVRDTNKTTAFCTSYEMIFMFSIFVSTFYLKQMPVHLQYKRLNTLCSA